MRCLLPSSTGRGTPVARPPHTSGVASCLEVGTAYRRTFKAGGGMCQNTCQPRWVQEGRGKGRGVPLEPGPEKAASFPTPTSAHLGAARLSQSVLLLLHLRLARNINLSR